jgi:hypothetical protein
MNSKIPLRLFRLTFGNRDFYEQTKNPYLDTDLKILEFLDDSANFN